MIFIFKKYKAFTVVYVIFMMVQLFSAQNNNFKQVHILTPLLLISLVVFFFLKTLIHGRFHRRLLMGLLFFLLSSVLSSRSQPGDSFWALSHGAACIGYICYIRAFYLDFRSAQALDKKNARIAIVVCSIFGMAFYLFLRPYLGTMKIPVMTYIFIVCIMMMMAVFRNKRVNPVSFNLTFLGAILLLTAASLYGYHYFVDSLYLSSLMSILSFSLAQYFIVMGGVERKLLHRA